MTKELEEYLETLDTKEELEEYIYTEGTSAEDYNYDTIELDSLLRNYLEGTYHIEKED